jgi:hypothetical protein
MTGGQSGQTPLAPPTSFLQGAREIHFSPVKTVLLGLLKTKTKTATGKTPTFSL